MRRTLTRFLALMTGALVVAFAATFALVRNPGTSPHSPSLGSGAEVYRELGCPACHSIAGVGNRRLPLDGVGSRLDPATIRRWIVTPAEMRPGVRKPRYGDTSPERLDAVVAYLSSLK